MFQTMYLRGTHLAHDTHIAPPAPAPYPPATRLHTWVAWAALASIPFLWMFSLSWSKSSGLMLRSS